MADLDAGLVSGLFGNDSGGGVEENGWCYDYDHCHFSYVSGLGKKKRNLEFNLHKFHACAAQQRPCAKDDLHENVRYTEGSAAWVLIASIIVFFMVINYQ